MTIHEEQHTILEGLVSHGYAGIDERSKMCYIMNEIKTNLLDSMKTQIISNLDLQNEIAQCIVLFKDYLAQTKVNRNQKLNIAAVNSHREGLNMTPRNARLMTDITP